MTQAQAIKQHLEQYKFIDPMAALFNYGCYRLAARIGDLRSAGMKIETTRKTFRDKNGDKVTHTIYRLVG